MFQRNRTNLLAVSILSAASVVAGRCAGQSNPKSVENRPVVADQPVDSAAARRVVQGFYDWWSPIIFRGETAIWEQTDKAARFLDPELVALLKGDGDARLDSVLTRDIIDLDPFVQAFEPCERYLVDRIRRQGQSYAVTVRPFCSQPGYQRPSVTVETAWFRDRWLITTAYFIHADTVRGDLRSGLCYAAMHDKRPERRPKKC